MTMSKAEYDAVKAAQKAKQEINEEMDAAFPIIVRGLRDFFEGKGELVIAQDGMGSKIVSFRKKS